MPLFLPYQNKHIIFKLFGLILDQEKDCHASTAPSLNCVYFFNIFFFNV